MSDDTHFYYCHFPDKGSGLTHCNKFVEGTSEDDVRSRAADHPRFTQWDTTSGSVRDLGEKTRDELEDALLNPVDPNEAILEDGTILIRDSDNRTVTEREP